MVKNSEVRYLIRMEDLRNVTVTYVIVTRNIDSGTETVYKGRRGGTGGKLDIICVENGSMNCRMSKNIRFYTINGREENYR